MHFYIDYVQSPYSKYFPATHQTWFTTDLTKLDFYTLPSQINITIGKRDFKLQSLSLGKIDRGYDDVPHKIFYLDSTSITTPSNIIDFPKSEAYTNDKTIYYNVSKSSINLTTTDKVSEIKSHPDDPS